MKFSKVCTLAGGVAIAASTLLIVPTESAQAATCNEANKFCGWKDAGYSNTRLIFDSSPAGSRSIFASQQDQMSSAKNFTNNKWCGVDQEAFAPDHTVISFGPGAQVPDLSVYGGYVNDNIDYFDVVTSGGTCPHSF